MKHFRNNFINVLHIFYSNNPHSYPSTLSPLLLFPSIRLSGLYSPFPLEHMTTLSAQHSQTRHSHTYTYPDATNNILYIANLFFFQIDQLFLTPLYSFICHGFFLYHPFSFSFTFSFHYSFLLSLSLSLLFSFLTISSFTLSLSHFSFSFLRSPSLLCTRSIFLLFYTFTPFSVQLFHSHTNLLLSHFQLPVFQCFLSHSFTSLYQLLSQTFFSLLTPSFSHSSFLFHTHYHTSFSLFPLHQLYQTCHTFSQSTPHTLSFHPRSRFLSHTHTHTLSLLFHTHFPLSIRLTLSPFSFFLSLSLTHSTLSLLLTHSPLFHTQYHLTYPFSPLSLLAHILFPLSLLILSVTLSHTFYTHPSPLSHTLPLSLTHTNTPLSH